MDELEILDFGLSTIIFSFHTDFSTKITSLCPQLLNMNVSHDISILSDPPLLEKVDKLRDLNIGQHVPLPQVKSEDRYLA
jgi:hypothetical protein